MPLRHGADQALAFRCPAARAGHVRRRPGFVEEDEAIRIQRRLQRRPNATGLGYVVALLLLSLEVLFFSVRPSRATTFHIAV